MKEQLPARHCPFLLNPGSIIEAEAYESLSIQVEERDESVTVVEDLSF